jgi:hypothetical protein
MVWLDRWQSVQTLAVSAEGEVKDVEEWFKSSA